MSFETSFVWVEPSVLAFGEAPGRWRSIARDLNFLKDEGITCIISLLEDNRNLDVYRENGFACHHFPVIDFGAPSQEQIKQCVQIISAARQDTMAAYVHCFAGIGRSGTIAAAWLIHSGHSWNQAIDTIRRLKLGTIESHYQMNALIEFSIGR